MSGKTLITLAIAAALGGTASVASAQQQGGAPSTYGAVQPCSLSGINPADHPEVFGNPEVARVQFGFVKGPDGNWQVIADCRNKVQR